METQSDNNPLAVSENAFFGELKTEAPIGCFWGSTLVSMYVYSSVALHEYRRIVDDDRGQRESRELALNTQLRQMPVHDVASLPRLVTGSHLLRRTQLPD